MSQVIQLDSILSQVENTQVQTYSSNTITETSDELYYAIDAQLAFGTFVPTMDYKNGIEIDTRNIVVMGPTLEKVVAEYKSATSPIKTAPKPGLIV